MPTKLTVHDVDEDIEHALKRRAATHGRSTEAEHREILIDVLRRPVRKTFAEVLAQMPDVGDDSDFDRSKL